jgi:hypothetical protein
MLFKLSQIIFIILLTKYMKVDTASFYTKVKVDNSIKPVSRDFRDGFAQVSIWGNSSMPSILNSFLNSSNLSGISSDSVDGNIPSPIGLPSDFGLARPMKAYQRFKNFNLRLGPFFHLQGIGAVYHHQTFHH